MGSCPGGEHEGPWALRHAELGRPVGYADTPLDDQQAMLGLHQTTNRPCWDSIGYAVLCYCPTRSVIKKYGLAESLQRMSQGSGQPEKEHTCEPPLLIWPASFPARAPQSERILVYLNVFWST